MEKWGKIGIALGVGVIVLLILVLVPLSFTYVDYYEMAFLKRGSTGRVDTSKVYKPGRYVVGPDFVMKPFPSVAHVVEFSNVAVFTVDRLEVWISASFQYFLREKDLHLLHKKYDIHYEDVLEKNAVDAFKNAATEFSMRDFIANRRVIEQQLFRVVKDRLGGTCCASSNCENEGNCEPGCIVRDECTEDDKGLFADVLYFQLLNVVIPSDVSDQFLDNLILGEQTEEEEFNQRAKIVKLETERQVQEINNEAEEIERNADADAELLLAYANANSTTIIERARITGLTTLFRRLNLNDVDYKRTFDYLRSIKLMDQAYLNVDFDQLVAGQLRD